MYFVRVLTERGESRQDIDSGNGRAQRQVHRFLQPRIWHGICSVEYVCVLELKKGFF
jgi:hypothetical protein